MNKQAVETMNLIREEYDSLGLATRQLLFALDGGFANRRVFCSELERTNLLVRCRKDTILCFPANKKQNPRRTYGTDKFSPLEIYKDESQTYSKTKVFYGGEERIIRYKEISDVLWQRGAKRKNLRLIVLAPTGYRLSPKSKTLYRDPAFLLTDDLRSPVAFLIQSYIDRWQIEVNHRDEKQLIGVQDPQASNDKAVDRVHSFLVASYSILLLASLKAFGAVRTNEYIEIPPWQRKRKRPSALDIINLARKEASENPEVLKNIGIDHSCHDYFYKRAA